MPFSPRELEDLRVVLRVFMGSRVDFYPITQILIFYVVGEFVWPSIWVVVLAGLSLGVAVLTGGGCPCSCGSSGGRRARNCIMRFVEWCSFSRLLSGSSS